MEVLFRNIDINGYTFLFSSIWFENQKPFIAYVRLQDREKVKQENILLLEDDLIPQIENNTAILMNNMINDNYESFKKRTYK